MLVQGILCKKCGDQLFSRSNHDCRGCSCKAVIIDGGFENQRVIGNFFDFKYITLEIPQTKEELYEDWNTKEDKYGLIKGSKIT